MLKSSRYQKLDISMKWTAVTSCFAILSICEICSGSFTPNPEGKLVDKLLSNYDPDIIPLVGPEEVLNVTMFFYLSRVESLEEKTQVFTSYGFIGMNWIDPFLTWDPSEHNNTNRIVIRAERIWLPELALLNSVEKGHDLSIDSKFRVAVGFDGLVVWVPAFRWRTSCPVDLEYFPFDTQSCKIQFINWIYNAQRIRFITALPTVNLQAYELNGEWDVVDTSTEEGNLTLPPDPTMFPLVSFTVKILRKPGYFILNVIFPSVIMTLATLLVFLLPVESGEKVSLSITIMLSYSVLLLVVSDITPRSGSGQPVLAYFMVVSMGLTATSLLNTVMILNIFYHNPTHPVPAWVKSCSLDWLARLTCFHPRKQVMSISVTPGAETVNSNGNNENKAHGNGVQKVPNTPKTFVAFKEHTVDTKEKEERENREDWQRVARIVDRTCLILTLVFVICMIMYLMISIKVQSI